MEQFISSAFKLGILGGGQLGKMLCQAARNWDVKTYVLDPNENCSAVHTCTKFSKGDFKDYNTVVEFGKQVDVLTIEIEAVNTEALQFLEKQGVKVYPSSKAIQTIQDKGLQKQVFKDNNIPTSAFSLYKEHIEIIEKVKNGELKLPFVQKVRKDGYDGRGVKVVKNESDLNDLLNGPSLTEEMVNIRKEISVIAARNVKGEITCFPPVEMEFNPEANLVEFLFSPSEISEEQTNKAIALAEKTIEAFDVVGVLAVEMFIDENGDILVNEIAPRPHNSGHQTIEANLTSQYAQHLRAILDCPLGDTAIIFPSVMINLLGEPGYDGSVKYAGLEECMKVSGFKLHVYGKDITKPYRKMGHVTVLDKELDKAKEKARYIQQTLKVIA